MLEQLMASPIAWAILSFCAVFSMIFAIVTWIKGKAKREISCYKTSYEIVRAGKTLIPELNLTFKNQEITDLVITKYALWNSGNQVLNWSDIVEAKKLRVISSDNLTKLLDVKIIKQSDETNRFVIENTEELSAEIKFDYVEKNDGIVIQIMHTGKNSDIGIECKIKGGKRIRYVNRDRSRKASKKLVKILMIVETVLVILGIVLGGGSIIAILLLLLQGPSKYSIVEMMVCLSTMMLVVIMGVTYMKLLKRMYHLDVPSKIRTVIEYEEFEN